MDLYIANKNYSSWSMRPWLVLREFDIPFREVMVYFDDMTADSPFKQTLAELGVAGCVPVLHDRDQVVWDTLAIVETLAENHPEHAIWPESPTLRARARSVCAEMHSGFGALRAACPMNIEAELGEAGAVAWRDRPGLRADVARIEQLWESLLQRSGGPMLFGEFCAADAFFAPVVFRLLGYSLPISELSQRYCAAVRSLKSVQSWEQAARQEHRFVVVDEPYRSRGS